MDCAGGSRSTDEAADSVRKCDPCSYKGLVNEARTYCGQCEEYMCVSCASAHSILKMSRHHVCTTVTGGVLPTEKVCVAPSASRSTYHVSGSTAPVSGCKPVSAMDVVSSTELSVPSDCITGSAMMPDGKIILSAYNNKQIILLNPDFTMLSTLTLPGKPGDVAVYGDNAAVVTLPKMELLQYIHVDTTSTLRAGRTKQTGLPCYGVAVHDDEVYVVGHDGNDWHVRVLDTRGKVTRRIGWASGNSTHITVGRGGTLYISDHLTHHITCYTNAGDVVYDVKHKGMADIRGMLADEDDNLLVCCWGSNDIHVLGKDGGHRRVILSSADGVVSPTSVSYRRSDQTLIVTMFPNTPSCRAYKLK